MNSVKNILNRRNSALMSADQRPSGCFTAPVIFIHKWAALKFSETSTPVYNISIFYTNKKSRPDLTSYLYSVSGNIAEEKKYGHYVRRTECGLLHILHGVYIRLANYVDYILGHGATFLLRKRPKPKFNRKKCNKFAAFICLRFRVTTAAHNVCTGATSPRLWLILTSVVV